MTDSPEPPADLDAPPRSNDPTPTAMDAGAVWRRLGPVGPLAVVATVLTLIGLFVLVSHAGSVGSWLKAQEHLAVPIYIAGFALLAGFALMPTHVQAALGGWAFGLATGSIGALCGIAGASMIGYVIARRVSGKRVTDLISEQPKWKAVYDALIGSGQLKALLIVTLLRVPPNSPFAITNLVMAACRVRPVVYLIGTVVGIAPRTIAAVYIGSGLTEFSAKAAQDKWLYIGGIVALVVVVCIIGALANRAIAKVTGDNRRAATASGSSDS